MRLVGDALFSDAIRTHATQTRNLASALGERMSGDTADAFHQRLVQAASQGGGRLLVVDTDGKVTDDTFGERCGTLLALSEVHTILRGEKDADYGFHLQDGAGKTQAPSVLDALTGRDVSRIWVGCFTAPLEEDGQRLGVLVLLTDVQETVDSLISVRDRMVFIFLLALAVVLVLAGLISRIVTKPVAELSGGIERMSKGDYEYRVHVPGKGEMAQLAAAFNQMSEQVHNLDEARNQFVSNASHELKTPLATIKILVESMMYQDDMDPALRKEFLGDIDKEIEQAVLRRRRSADAGAYRQPQASPAPGNDGAGRYGARNGFPPESAGQEARPADCREDSGRMRDVCRFRQTGAGLL